jgi:tetratricopeptide (TPR) repeat protein
MTATLLALVAAIYHPVARFGFVNWDDYTYVVNNGYVKHGLSWSNVLWAFTTTYNASYLPLAWLSHMLDCQLFGLWAGGHHLVSAFWHAMNTLTLFGFMRAATGSGARSFWVAALFAVHPLHVESVAWISERKDVLATFFWFSGLWAYCRYAHNPSVRRYVVVAGAFVLGLLSKPMLVTFPFTLLLLDYWPLKRPRWRSLVTEKIPLFLLVPVFAATTLVSQKTAHAVSTLDDLPLGPRLANAVVSVGQYVRHAVFPVNLAAIYPHPGREIAWGALAASTLMIVGLTAAALKYRRRSPYLLMGWLWFLGTLVPVLGLVQVGTQAWADRYTYVPYVGLFVALVWLAADFVQARPRLLRPAVVTAAALLFVFAGLAHAQVFTWRDDPSLFGRVVERSPQSFYGHSHLGTYYRIHGRWNEAVASYRKAVDAAPERFDGWTGLGLALQGAGRAEEAVDALTKACRLNPSSAAAAANLAQMDDALGRLDDAERGYRRALELNPLEEKALFGLGTMLSTRGDLDGARPLVKQLAQLSLGGWTTGVTASELGPLCIRVELWPEAQGLLEVALGDNRQDAEAWSFLGLARQRQHLYGPAVEAYREAVRLQPRMANARFNLGVAFLQLGDLAGADEAYRSLNALDPELAAKLLDLTRRQMTVAPPVR